MMAESAARQQGGLGCRSQREKKERKKNPGSSGRSESAKLKKEERSDDSSSENKVGDVMTVELCRVGRRELPE